MDALRVALLVLFLTGPFSFTKAQVASTSDVQPGCPVLPRFLTKERVKGRTPLNVFTEELAADLSNVSLRLLAFAAERSSAKQDELAQGFPDTDAGRSGRQTVEAFRLYEQLQFDKGLEKLDAALRLDPCNAWALFAIAQHDQVLGLQAQAFAALEAAHKIAPDYDEITAMRAEYLTDRERLSTLQHVIETSAFLQTDMQRKAAEALLLADMHRPHGACKQQAGGRSTSLPFFLVRQDVEVKKGFEQLAIRIAVNGKLRRMLVDTTASGVMLTEPGAKGAGLAIDKATHFAHASEVKIGDFTFQDCDIQLVRLGDAGGSFDGILGIDALRSYLIALDFGGLKLSLSPLPVSPMKTATPYLETAELSQVERDSTGVYAVDAYRPASMRNWTSFAFAEHFLLVPLKIDGGKAASGVLMTSLERSILMRSAVPPSIYLDALGYPWIPGIFIRWNPRQIDLFQAKDLSVHFAGLQLSLGRALIGSDPKKVLPAGIVGIIGLDYLKHLSVTIDMRDHLITARLSQPS